MKFLSNITSKSRLKNTSDKHDIQHIQHIQHEHEGQRTIAPRPNITHAPPGHRPNPTIRWTQPLVRLLMSYVCPHSTDDTYTPCEDSMIDGGCMLCDMRDLSSCALVNRQWSEAAQNVLYHNIRIDAVHYCEREAILALKRKRRSTSGRNGGPLSPPQERLQLLSRTVRDNSTLAALIQYLKIPYMTREGSVADLARTVAFLPHLLYVDLPDGFYADGASFLTLKQELQSRCPKIRYMKYAAGSENSFQTLPQTCQWHEIESIALSQLDIEPATVIDVLAHMGSLRKVTLAEMPLLNDSTFNSESGSPPFPPFQSLTLQDIPGISIEGLVAYLSTAEPRDTLTSLKLVNAGLPVHDLYQILAVAPSLTTLHVTASVSRSFPSLNIARLASRTLRSLHYEISNADSTASVNSSQSESYYTYLSSSILSGSLPNLSHLYALSVAPQTFLQTAPTLKFSKNRTGSAPPPLSLGISRPLHLHTKSVSEMEWESTLLLPNVSVKRGTSPNPHESETLHQKPPLSPQYRNQGRQSMVVGNGFGGLLTVPTEEVALGSPKSRDKRKDLNAWMG